MRRTLLVGAVLTVAATLVVLLSDLLDLKLESAALLGVALGAVVALVPDRSPIMRLVGFLAGLVLAWIGYVLRAGVLPDSTGGRAVTVALVLGLCVVVAVGSLGRIPLWATFLGAGAMAGAYEYTFAAAPPEVMSTSMSTATSLLMTAAVGFTLVSMLAPRQSGAPAARRGHVSEPRHNDPTALDDMMEKSQ
ncbi:MAG: hypothetical protein ACLGH4_08700 [Actinomycetes bacterium]